MAFDRQLTSEPVRDGRPPGAAEVVLYASRLLLGIRGVFDLDLHFAQL